MNYKVHAPLLSQYLFCVYGTDAYCLSKFYAASLRFRAKGTCHDRSTVKFRPTTLWAVGRFKTCHAQTTQTWFALDFPVGHVCHLTTGMCGVSGQSVQRSSTPWRSSCLCSLARSWSGSSRWISQSGRPSFIADMRAASNRRRRSCRNQNHYRGPRRGSDSHGRWVAQDQRGLCGGEAIRYAMFESGRRPQAVIMVPGVLEFDMTRIDEAPGQRTTGGAA
jgi:hypothetical protein